MTKKYIKNWLIENHSKEILKPLREKNFKLYLKQLVHSDIDSRDLNEVAYSARAEEYNAANTPEEVERTSNDIAACLAIYLNKESIVTQIAAALKDHPDVIQSIRESPLLTKYRK